MTPVRSILAATDLTERGTTTLQSAAVWAQAFGASLHVVHVAPLGEEGRQSELSDALRAHVQESLNALEGVDTAVVFDRPFHGILVRAAAVHADLIVMGPHRGSATSARWRGTTAERVARSADVPCLVVTRPLDLPLQHLGVPVDFSPATRGAVLLTAAWLPTLKGNASDARLSLVHVTSDREENTDRLTTEWDKVVELAGPQSADVMDTNVVPVTLAGTDPAETVADWAASSHADLLVVPTEARRGLKRLWTGNPATALTLRAPCPVLLVPPALWRRAPLRVRRIATDGLRTDGTDRPHEWMRTHLPTLREGLDVVLVHGDEDLVRAVRRTNADLLAIPLSPPPSPEVARLLERTPVPVLLLRDPPADGFRHLLVAVDTGDIWYEKFGWAKLLSERFDADVTVFHAIDLSLRGRVRREPGGEFVPGISAWTDDVEGTVVPAMRTWLEERVRLAGLPADRVNVMVGLQAPSFAIPNLAARIKADLVVVAAHSESRAGRVPLSPVTRAVLAEGSSSVLAVIDRARRLADRAAQHAGSRALAET